PADRLVFTILIVVGLAVLVRRGRRSLAVLANNWPILLYFFYCLLSVLWSDFPDIAFKRWIKATGDVVMMLIVVTDGQPIAALRRFFSRVGFVLTPVSVLLIKYYPYLGRIYNDWTGEPENTGASLNKNMLGVTTLVIGLGAFWQVSLLWKKSDQPDRFRQLAAQCILLGFVIWILFNAHCATCGACFTFGAGLILATRLNTIRRRPAAVHVLVLGILLVGGLAVLTGGDEGMIHAMGRNSNLTGRTEIWQRVISMAPNALVGAGFESFWLGPRLDKLWHSGYAFPINEAHDGYIEVYLELGWIGVVLIALVLIHGYRRCIAAFRVDPSAGSLMLAYVLATPLYNITEAGFRMLHPVWSFLLLAIFGATQISLLSAENAQPKTIFAESAPWSTIDARTPSALVRR
ncbi:MAG: O-antigen ligase family protein, partial [Silvibacterium sp.]